MATGQKTMVVDMQDNCVSNVLTHPHQRPCQSHMRMRSKQGSTLQSRRLLCACKMLDNCCVVHHRHKKSVVTKPVLKTE